MREIVHQRFLWVRPDQAGLAIEDEAGSFRHWKQGFAQSEHGRDSQGAQHDGAVGGRTARSRANPQDQSRVEAGGVCQGQAGGNQNMG